MKKTSKKVLQLNRETVRTLIRGLSRGELVQLVGGAPPTLGMCPTGPASTEPHCGGSSSTVVEP